MRVTDNNGRGDALMGKTIRVPKCGCTIEGEGTLPDPVRIVFCTLHTTISGFFDAGLKEAEELVRTAIREVGNELTHAPGDYERKQAKLWALSTVADNIAKKIEWRRP